MRLGSTNTRSKRENTRTIQVTLRALNTQTIHTAWKRRSFPIGRNFWRISGERKYQRRLVKFLIIRNSQRKVASNWRFNIAKRQERGREEWPKRNLLELLEVEV